jgi:hypothetical protein
VRLPTRANLHLNAFDEEDRNTFRGGSDLTFERWKHSGYDHARTSVPKRARGTLTDEQLKERKGVPPETLSGYAVAGRLNVDSSGALVMSRAGIMARLRYQRSTLSGSSPSSSRPRGRRRWASRSSRVQQGTWASSLAREIGCAERLGP